MADPVQAKLNSTKGLAIRPSFQELLPILQWLDKLLERTTSAAQIAYGSEAAADPYRGLHVTLEEIEQLLNREPGVPTFQIDTETGDESLSNLVSRNSPLFWLQQTYGLSAFDIEVVAIALAPELDRRYERIYAYLQENVTYTLPSVDLALNLLCPSGSAKLIRRDRFAPNAPLIQHCLLHLIPDPNQVKSTLLGHYLVLDEQVICLLLGHKGLDSRLAPFCQLIQPTLSLTEIPLQIDVKQALSVVTIQNWQRQKPLRFYFEGVDRASKRRTAEALAREIKGLLLVVDLARILDTRDIEPTLQLLMREASFQNALLYIDNLDAWKDKERGILYQSLLEAIAQHTGMTILVGVKPWIPSGTNLKGIVTVPFTIPDFTLRRFCWQTQLTEAGISLERSDLDALVDRFLLTPDQIADVVVTACNRLQWQTALDSADLEALEFNIQNPKIEHLYAAARTQSGHELTAMAQKIKPKYSLDDIVLPPDPQTQLREICNQTKYRHIVHREWGFDSKLSLGKGLNVLFHGSPGTGKTMAAEAIAYELQLDLYKIDLSQIVSKYIGETEKNLNSIFAAADNANAILLFDEADALFGKRSEVKDAHDRYANLEVAYLLQKMEEYEGMTILTTNLRQNLDQAFTRRLRFIVGFPFPSEEHRCQIWKCMWPKETPLGTDLDFQLIAQKFELAGGNIRNITLAAAFLAAVDGESVSMKHLSQAIRRELQKMGRLVNEVDFFSD
ncbi:ATP-binding protein [Nostoc sp.]|uniref:ATP-binding protein n=1 Tax=Nostoc sp. TaxID=1180 RepID=UPI002FFB1956